MSIAPKKIAVIPSSNKTVAKAVEDALNGSSFTIYPFPGLEAWSIRDISNLIVNFQTLIISFEPRSDTWEKIECLNFLSRIRIKKPWEQLSCSVPCSKLGDFNYTIENNKGLFRLIIINEIGVNPNETCVKIWERYCSRVVHPPFSSESLKRDLVPYLINQEKT